MAKLTKNEVAAIDTAGLLARAEAIREAITAKSVTAEMVGSLFCDLVECCGSVRDALALFLEVNVGELEADIDERLSGADAAALKATSAAQKAEATRVLVDGLLEKLSGQTVYAPTRIEIVRCPLAVTVTNGCEPRIDARLLPTFSLGGVLFMSDNRAVAVTPDGKLTPLAVGRSTVQAVASTAPSVYRTLTITVVPPRLRLGGGGELRLDGRGRLRLT